MNALVFDFCSSGFKYCIFVSARSLQLFRLGSRTFGPRNTAEQEVHVGQLAIPPSGPMVFYGP